MLAWMKEQGWLGPAFLVTLLAFVAAVIRPAIKEGIRRMFTVEYTDAMQRLADVEQTAEAHADRLEAHEASIKAQGHTLSKIEQSVETLPSLSADVSRMAKALEAFADDMKEATGTMIRLEERQKAWDGAERRYRTEANAPRNRKSDT